MEKEVRRIGISPFAEILQEREDCIMVGEITPSESSRFKTIILVTPNDRSHLPLPLIKGNQEKGLLTRLQEEGVITSVVDFSVTHIDTDEKNVVFGRATIEKKGEEQKIIFYPTVKFAEDAIDYFYASLSEKNQNIDRRQELMNQGLNPMKIPLKTYKNLPVD